MRKLSASTEGIPNIAYTVGGNAWTGDQVHAGTVTCNGYAVFNSAVSFGGQTVFDTTAYFVFEPDAAVSFREALGADMTFADDSAAQAGGYAVGDLYFTGTKFRVRMV